MDVVQRVAPADGRASLPSAARRDLFRFLVAEEPEGYWTVLDWLSWRRRMGELEVDFDELRSAVPTGRDLSDVLRQLEKWGNLSTRIEPRKIRTLEDRRVERYRVMLADETAEILEYIAQESSSAALADAELAEDRLRTLEAGMGGLLELLRSPAFDERQQLEAAASAVRQLKREVMQADKDLLLFAQAIRKQSRAGRPSGGDVAQIVGRLQRYIARYLDSLMEVRLRCEAHLTDLCGEPLAAQRDALQAFLVGVAEESLHLTGRRGRSPVVEETLMALARFFEPLGELERRCNEIYSAAGELVRSLKRHLDELLTRSQRRALLRSATERLLIPQGPDEVPVDRFFDELWLSVRPHALEGSATSSDREEVVLPGPTSRHGAREVVAFVQRGKRPTGISRSLAERELNELNAFVQRAILRGACQAPLDGGHYAQSEDVHLLFKALRAGRDRRNPMVRRLLRYKVELGEASTTPSVELPILGGVLTVPPLLFIWEDGHDA